MENLQNQEIFTNWVRPDLEHERGELERVLKEFFDLAPTEENFQKLADLIQKEEMTELDEENWQHLENTDSFDSVRKGHLEDAEEIIKEYNKDPKRGWQRNVPMQVDRLKTGKEVQAPIIVKDKDGKMHLMSGNTRLMVARALGIRPKVIIVEFKP